MAVVRLSGLRAIEIAQAIFRSKEGWARATRRVAVGRIVVEASEIDSGLAWVMRAPNSYTGEDTAEISCHGSMGVVEAITAEAIRLGARLAQRGEFTRRAFLNGKLDLVQAEGIVDLIRAGNRFGVRNAYGAVSGELSARVERLRTVAQEARARVELSLEFDEEGGFGGCVKGVAPRLARAAQEAELLAATFESVRRRSDGWLVALLGVPNVGKSTLLNALLGEDRAIVAPEAGTTRDLVEGRVWWEGEEVRLVDTAGVGEGGSVLERAGVGRALEAAARADVVVVVVEGSREWRAADSEVVEQIVHRRWIVAVSKIDLGRKLQVPAWITAPVVEVSGLTGEGLEELAAGVYSMLATEGVDEVGLTRERHRACMDRMGIALRRAQKRLVEGGPEECCAVDLAEAVDAGDELLGERVGGDVLDVIFNEFCIGK